MRYFIDIVTESYHDTILCAGETVEVWKNPSWRELNKMLRATEYSVLRGLVDGSGDLFVWSDEETEHLDVADKLNINWDVRAFLNAEQVSFYPDDLDDLSSGGEQLKANPNLVRIYGEGFPLEIY